MSNDRSHGIERAARESDCHVAALLSSALIARESTHLRITQQRDFGGCQCSTSLPVRACGVARRRAERGSGITQSDERFGSHANARRLQRRTQVSLPNLSVRQVG